MTDQPALPPLKTGRNIYTRDYIEGSNHHGKRRYVDEKNVNDLIESVKARERWIISKLQDAWDSANTFEGPCSNIMSMKIGLLVKAMEKDQ